MAVADRLAELVRDPNLIAQRGLNLCGPAVFLRAWIRRNPTRFLDFAMELYDTGESSIDGYKVRPDLDAMLDSNYRAAVAVHGGRMPPAADWMLMGALRDTENAILDYAGLPDGDVSAVTAPSEIKEWLDATGDFGLVRDEADVSCPGGVDHALSLDPAGSEVMVLLDSGAMTQDPSWIDAPFRNHWVGLEAPVLAGDGLVLLTYWTYGRPRPTDRALPVDLFEATYRGAIIVA